jgi:hypothetical protein
MDSHCTTDVTCGAGTANPSGTPDSTPGFSGNRAPRSLVFCIILYISLFVLLSFISLRYQRGNKNLYVVGQTIQWQNAVFHGLMVNGQTKKDKRTNNDI